MCCREWLQDFKWNLRQCRRYCSIEKVPRKIYLSKTREVSELRREYSGQAETFKLYVCDTTDWAGVESTVAGNVTGWWVGGWLDNKVPVLVRTRSSFDVHCLVLKLSKDRSQCLNCAKLVKHLKSKLWHKWGKSNINISNPNVSLIDLTCHIEI